MSVTAFNRMRREQAAKKELEDRLKQEAEEKEIALQEEKEQVEFPVGENDEADADIVLDGKVISEVVAEAIEIETKEEKPKRNRNKK